MGRRHPIRGAAIALTSMTAIPTPPEWLSSGPVQAAGWFPAVGGILGVAGYLVVKFAEDAGATDAAPYAIAVAIVALWAVLTWGLHWRALTSVVLSLLSSIGLGRIAPSEGADVDGADGVAPWVHTLAAAVVALLAAGEAVAIGSFLVAHESPVLAIPVLARFAATAAAWLGKPVEPSGEGGALFGRPTVISVVAAVGTIALATLALWIGFDLMGLALAGFGIFTALAVPHLLSMAFEGVTLDVMEASVVIAEVVIFAAFALFR
jgi:hypothetical protein